MTAQVTDRRLLGSSIRRGFTLIELLMVIVIIALLVSFLIPAIAGAYRKGKEAAESTEIANLVGALQKFKDRFGVYPPSQIILREDGAYDATRLPVLVSNGNRNAVFDESISIQYLRRLWPQIVINVDGRVVNYTNNGPASDIDRSGNTADDPNDFYDWNGDGLNNGPWFLEGDECLVFFLGGIPTGQFRDSSNNPQRPNVPWDVRKYPPACVGFSKAPHWPCQRVTGSAGVDGPFFDMPSDRLIDSDQDSFWELLPSRKSSLLGAYAYFSAYEGVGYRPDDLNLLTEPAPNGSVTQLQDFAVLWSLASYPSPPRQGTAPNFYIRSPGPNPYTIGTPYSTAVGWAPRYHKPDGFQIISPGPEAGYGHGGEFPLDPSLDNGDDNDNLTNFSAATLQDGKI